MAASKTRYYPGLLAALLLVLLRMAIGWHFLYEGVEKVYSTPEGRKSFLARVLPPLPAPPPMEKAEPPFSAEGYLRNATGPLAPNFRSLVPDVDSRGKLDLNRIKANWGADLERVNKHYNFTKDQHDEAEKELKKREAEAEDWFRTTENRDKIEKYFRDLAHVRAVESNPKALESERSQAFKDRGAVEADRRALVQVVDGWTNSLRDAWNKLATPEQAKAAGPVPMIWTQLEWINAITMYGLIAVGACLLLGLFTPLAALGGAAYLAMFYLSMPPWPGLPQGPMSEGHYLFVNKNLIELCACLVLVKVPTAHWIGLDPFLFGWTWRRHDTAPTKKPAPDKRRASPQPPIPDIFIGSDR